MRVAANEMFISKPAAHCRPTRTYLWGNLGRCVLTSQDYHTPGMKEMGVSETQSALVKAVPNEPKFPVISRQLRLGPSSL